MKRETLVIVWIVLVVLTILEYTFAELKMPAIIAFAGILLASFIKYLGVAFEFLELKHAHPFWKFITVTIAVVFLSTITLIYLPNIR